MIPLYMESLERLLIEYKKYQDMRLDLNMARGKPCKQQLDLSMPMMDVLNSQADMNCEDGIDCRNYGILGGIPECKRLFGDIIEAKPENILIFGNISYYRIGRKHTINQVRLNFLHFLICLFRKQVL